ncbi:transposable element Tcb2 transposase [Trichonephila clavipes]|nr:transposable element Tcb2 transposase [Trichonephila clavipes]
MARRNHIDDFTCGRMIVKLEEGRNVTSVAAEFGINKSVVSRAWKAFQTTGTAVRKWYREHKNWTTDQWSRVLFTDESRLSTRSYSQRVLIWREIGTRIYTSNIKERHHYGGPGVLVWGGIMLNLRTEIHIFDTGSVIGDRYCEEVLLLHVCLFRRAIDPYFNFMDDNARPHRTLFVKELLGSEDITRMDWPAYSPDLNPIEHVALYGLVEFFKNDEGHNVTVNGDRYRAMITNFFIPELNNQDVQELWFQQDGATSHTARATIDLLKDTFGDRLISRFGPVNWPPRSCDLTPLDYFLWGYVKSLVYADKPQTLDHLEDNIRRVIADIRPQMLEKVIENWTSRLDYIRASCGSHMPEIIFKM